MCDLWKTENADKNFSRETVEEENTWYTQV